MTENSDKNLDSEVSSYQKTDAIFANILLAALFSNFLIRYGYDFITTQEISALLMIAQTTFLVIFFLIRIYPKKVSFGKKDWVFALAGTWLPLLILPTETNLNLFFALPLQMLGTIISIGGILSLNRSFAIVPALREVKTKGMYSIMRHPIYFGYIISFACIIMQNFSLLNCAVFCAVVTCDIFRILGEERILSEDPKYAEYMKRVRWRLIPFIW